MPILIRMPDDLDAQVRDKAKSLGISINALLCVAVDAYLRGGFQAPPEPAKPNQAPTPAPEPENASKVGTVESPGKLSKAERREITRQLRQQRK